MTAKAGGAGEETIIARVGEGIVTLGILLIIKSIGDPDLISTPRQ